jgi:hypothetical protein
LPISKANAVSGGCVAAKIWTGLESRGAYLRRLSVVYAVELRQKIVTELYMREMSPKQFHERFGGGSLSRVTKNFERLEESGWLRRVRSEGPGGRRRGAVEGFYRATEPAIFDLETWPLLPFSLRIAFSWTLLKQLAERWREAVEHGTFDARPERQRTCASLLLDRRGWDRVNAAVGELFVSLFEEQADARLRIFHSGEEALVATVALFAFESPTRGSEPVGPSLVEVPQDSLVPFPLRLSKVIADLACMRIVAEANRRAISVTEFHREHGERLDSADVDAVRRRFKMLTEVGWLKVVERKTGGRRRGAMEYFYRATGPAFRDDDPWQVPAAIGDARSWAFFERFSRLAKEAMKAGTFDARTDRIATWSLLRLDRQGWERVTAAVEDLHRLALAEQERARARMRKSGEKPVPTTVMLAAFESPKTGTKEP